MNIVIDDKEMTRIIGEEFSKVRTRSMFGDSSLEKAIKNAVHEIVKDRVKEMVRSDKALMGALKKSLEDSLEQQMGEFGKRVAKAICDRLEAGIEAEFREYE